MAPIFGTETGAALSSIFRNRNFFALISANTLLAIAFPVQLILGGLAGLMLAPSEILATLPSSVQTLAALIAAAPFSLLMGRKGRRFGFFVGAIVTCVGALCAVLALLWQSFSLLCAAHFLMGAGWSSFQYFRFAAGEVTGKELRPVAISLMLTSGLIAAIIGPEVFVLSKDALAPIPFAGAYASIGGVALLGALPLLSVRMTKPKITQRQATSTRQTVAVALRRPVVRKAVGTAAVAQGVMVFLMIPTPLAMLACGFEAGDASDVIRWHIVAMFAPSFFTGFLIRRFGAGRVANSGLAIITLACVGAALGLSSMHFYGALIVLGVGWNLGFIGATALLESALSTDEKPAVQGANDTIIGFVSVICAFAAGGVLASWGWAILASCAALMTVATLAVLMRQPRLTA